MQRESRMETRPTIGIAGLGRMGHPIAANVLEAGFRTVIWNRTRDKAADLLERGAVWAENPDAIAGTADIVLTSLADPAAVESVYFGPDGLLDRARSDTILVDLSTGSPTLARRIAAAARERGATFLDRWSTRHHGRRRQVGVRSLRSGLCRYREGGVLPRRER
jgi:3-hydroxyisobutyrate dehydrogenase